MIIIISNDIKTFIISLINNFELLDICRYKYQMNKLIFFSTKSKTQKYSVIKCQEIFTYFADIVQHS
jgi:hypothetical protein